MRPQHDAADNFKEWVERTVLKLYASMRPQHDAADNFTPLFSHETETLCFNEAAA